MGAENWSLGDEIVGLLRRWHLLGAAALLGGLAGWLFALLLPPVYEAEALLSVSFNTDAFYLIPDDYKHQQFSELEELTLSDMVLADTLARLDPASPLTVRELRERLDPRWRNAGAWQLVAKSGDPDEAEELALAWREAVLAHAADALAHAAEFNELNRLLTIRARELERVESDLNTHRLALQDVRVWLADPAANDGEAGGVHLARRIAALLTPSGTAPEGDPLVTGAADWLAAAEPALVAEIGIPERRLSGLHAEYEALGDLWLEELDLSIGFSAYVRVDLPENEEIRVERTVENAPFSLAGAAAGALGFAGYRLTAVVRRKEDGKREI
jgi:hypothetical protein